MKKFAQANEEKLFVKKESPEGILVYPANSDAILTVGSAPGSQEDELLEDAQLRASKSRKSPIKGRTHPGAWSFTTYVKPSGTPGTAPEADVLFECGMGKKTPTPGVKVEYLLDSSINYPSFSMWRKVGHTLFASAGCTVNQMEIKIAGNEIASINWSGEFMKRWYAGTSVLTEAAIASDAHIHVDDATRYSDEKMKITVGADTNGGAGYLITGINYATHQINISPVIGTGALSGAEVAPLIPTNPAEIGDPVHGKLGIVTIDTKKAVVLDATITLSNNIKYYEDEKNGKWYPTVYGAPGFRDVTGTLRMYFYKNMPSYFYRSSAQIKDALIVPAGNVAGRIMEVSCPFIEYKTPPISGDEEVMIELPFSAYGSVGDDELKITFK